MGEAYESPPGLPQIPECDVEPIGDGTLSITHKASGRTAVAQDEADAIVQGAILRCLASYRWVNSDKEIPFRTGGPA